MSLRTYRVEYEARPWTTNAERRLNHWRRAEMTREWRQAFAWLARAQHIPTLAAINVHAQPWQKGGVLQDTGACHPAVKAAVDGLVDAGVLPDDSPRHLLTITYAPPQRGRDALTLTIEETHPPIQ